MQSLKQRQLIAKRDADKIREILARKEAEKLARLRKEKEDAEADAAAIREELERDALQQSTEKKTKTYFIIDKFNRQVPPEKNPVYFGEHKKMRDAWVPHGVGQMLLDNEIHIEGLYNNGALWGQAKYVEANGSTWNGTFYDGHMHGIGVYTDIETGVPLEARMIKSELICYLNELEPGVQVEINDSSLCVPLGSRATILKNTKGWKFRCRFQDELNPRERQVDFSTVKDFKVLRKNKKAYDLSAFGLRMDETRAYDYIKDTYQLPVVKSPLASDVIDQSSALVSSPNRQLSTNISRSSTSSSFMKNPVLSKAEQLDADTGVRVKAFLENAQSIGPNLGIAGSRKTADMRYMYTTPLAPESRKSSDYREHTFEARTLGIGKTMEKELDLEEAAKKKSEWAKILAKRREEERQEKQKRVEEEQQQALAEASAKNAEKRRLKEEEAAKTRALIEEEERVWEEKQREEELKAKQRQEQRVLSQSPKRSPQQTPPRTPAERK